MSIEATEVIESSVALAVLSIAVKKVPSPLLHALTYYLKHNEIDLGYHFNLFLHPREALTGWLNEYEYDVVQCPYSLELADDLANLLSAGILQSQRGSVEIISPGPVLKKYATVYKDRFNRQSKVKYPKLKKIATKALSHPKRLLEQCYKWYINEV